MLYFQQGGQQMAQNQYPQYNQYGMGKPQFGLQGTMAGASAGSLLGPWGSVAGGVAGLGMDIHNFVQDKRDYGNYLERTQNMYEQNMRLNNPYAENANYVMGREGGSNVEHTPAELENDEIVLKMDKKTGDWEYYTETTANDPSHEEGGVKMMLPVSNEEYDVHIFNGKYKDKIQKALDLKDNQSINIMERMQNYDRKMAQMNGEKYANAPVSRYGNKVSMNPSPNTYKGNMGDYFQHGGFVKTRTGSLISVDDLTPYQEPLQETGFAEGGPLESYGDAGMGDDNLYNQQFRLGIDIPAYGNAGYTGGAEIFAGGGPNKKDIIDWHKNYVDPSTGMTGFDLYGEMDYATLSNPSQGFLKDYEAYRSANPKKTGPIVSAAKKAIAPFKGSMKRPPKPLEPIPDFNEYMVNMHPTIDSFHYASDPVQFQIDHPQYAQEYEQFAAGHSEETQPLDFDNYMEQIEIPGYAGFTTTDKINFANNPDYQKAYNEYLTNYRQAEPMTAQEKALQRNPNSFLSRTGKGLKGAAVKTGAALKNAAVKSAASISGMPTPKMFKAPRPLPPVPDTPPVILPGTESTTSNVLPVETTIGEGLTPTYPGDVSWNPATGEYESKFPELSPKVTTSIGMPEVEIPGRVPPSPPSPNKRQRFASRVGDVWNKFVQPEDGMNSFRMAKIAGVASLANNLLQRPPSWIGAPQMQARQVPFQQQVFDKGREAIEQHAQSMMGRGRRNIASLSDLMASEQAISEKSMGAQNQLTMGEQEAQMKVDSENARLHAAAQDTNIKVAAQSQAQNIAAQSQFAQNKATAISKDVQGLIQTQGLQEQYKLTKDYANKQNEIQEKALETQATMMGYHSNVTPESYGLWKDQQQQNYMTQKAGLLGIDLAAMQASPKVINPATGETDYDAFKLGAMGEISGQHDWNSFRRSKAEEMNITDPYMIKALGL